MYVCVCTTEPTWLLFNLQARACARAHTHTQTQQTCTKDCFLSLSRQTKDTQNSLYIHYIYTAYIYIYLYINIYIYMYINTTRTYTKERSSLCQDTRNRSCRPLHLEDHLLHLHMYACVYTFVSMRIYVNKYVHLCMYVRKYVHLFVYSCILHAYTLGLVVLFISRTTCSMCICMHAYIRL